MRYLLALATTAVAMSISPASAYVLSSGCQDGDWQVIEISSGGNEYVEVCTDIRPDFYVSYCVLHPLACLKGS